MVEGFEEVKTHPFDIPIEVQEYYNKNTIEQLNKQRWYYNQKIGEIESASCKEITKLRLETQKLLSGYLKKIRLLETRNRYLSKQEYKLKKELEAEKSF